MKIKLFITAMTLSCLMASGQQSDRAYWSAKAYQMAAPVLRNLSEGTLRKNMPQEHPQKEDPKFVAEKSHLRYTHLEAVGRTLCGIAPWLECDADGYSSQRLELIMWAHKGLKNSVDSLSPDFLNFRTPSQPLVDAAFLAEAFLRSPKVLWGGLDAKTKKNMIREMRNALKIRAFESNWLLFTATIETFLASIGEKYDVKRIEYAMTRMLEWYKGDGVYGDGKDLHNDYYNSFVIQPMLVDVVVTMNKITPENPLFSDKTKQMIIRRASRYAEVLERSISPEGTFPVVGRSILYRTGAMHALSQAVLMGNLPKDMAVAQVRPALTLVIKNLLDFPGTYTEDGWIRMGFCGPEARKTGESYLSTGSMYLASSVFLPLGLSPSDPFWTSKAEPWTSRKAWSGMAFPIDGALYQ